MGAKCSGFLVSRNLIVTAGHCVQSLKDCTDSKWVFDFKVDPAKPETIEVPTSAVYSCKRIIERVLDEVTKNDYALIQLDRYVSDRKPLQYRSSGIISIGEDVVVIGHPDGLPTKIADGAMVRSLGPVFFVADLDSFGGNSGSAVVNHKTGEVEGILVRGEKDYVLDSSRGCWVPKRCEAKTCSGEDVTLIRNIKSLQNL